MKTASKILMVGVLIGVVFGSTLLAEERGRISVIGGIFIRTVEQEVGERVYTGMVIKPFERDDHVTVLVPRRSEELGEVVRGLREGQEVRIALVREDGQMWVRRMEAEHREEIQERPEGRRRLSVRREVIRRDEDFRERREPERPRAHLEQIERELREIIGVHFDRLAREFRELMAHVERLERELRELREENERLRMELRERSGAERERERDARIRREGREREEREIRVEIERRREAREREGRERRREVEEQREIRERERRDRPRERGEVREAEPSLPDGMIGFRGVLIGRLLRKLDRGFVLKVERVTKIWETNRADKPEAAVGKELIITIPSDQETGGPFLRTLRTLKTGEPVLVEAFHFGGNHLTVVEQLRRYD